MNFLILALGFVAGFVALLWIPACAGRTVAIGDSPTQKAAAPPVPPAGLAGPG